MQINWQGRTVLYADVSGFGTFRIKPISPEGFRVYRGVEPIGSIHPTQVAAQDAVQGIVNAVFE